MVTPTLYMLTIIACYTPTCEHPQAILQTGYTLTECNEAAANVPRLLRLPYTKVSCTLQEDGEK